MPLHIFPIHIIHIPTIKISNFLKKLSVAILSLRKLKQEGCSECEVSLGYTEGARLTKVTQKDLVSINKQRPVKWLSR